MSELASKEGDISNIKKLKKNELILLNPDAKSPRALDFENGLKGRVIGQERAVRSIASLYQIFLAGMTNPTRPIGTMLFLGPTGSGKTHVVEAAADKIFGDPNAIIKIDCAEFQHSHEIAKLIGSPPGYLGHRETTPMLSQENLDHYRTEENPFTLILLDEVEKASDALWQLLLGVLDKGRLTLGDNRQVDFSQTMIFMTSNLGAKEMSELITGSIGFAPAKKIGLQETELDQKIYRTAMEAARRKFSPEFMNRIDKVVAFRSLKSEQLDQILSLELRAVQRRIDEGTGERFTFKTTDEAKEFLLAEGLELRYGARHLKRVVERFVVNSLANLAATGQARLGDFITIDFDSATGKLLFFRDEAESVGQTSAENSLCDIRSGGAGGTCAA